MKCRFCLLVKTSEDFYKSNKTKCKECIKESTKQNRLEKLEYYRAYDRKRSSQPHRVSARKAYSQTPEGKIAGARAKKKWAISNAARRHAHNALNNALKSGKVRRQPCFICGEKAEAHHPDYSSPLSVTWLCPQHHKDAHRALAELLYEQGQRENLKY